MSDRIRSSNGETVTAQFKPSNSEPITTSSDHHQKETVITNGDNYIVNASNSYLHERSEGATTLSTEQINSKAILPSASPKIDQLLESTPSALDQTQTTITSSAPPLVVPPTSDVRDEEALQPPDTSEKLVDEKMDDKKVQDSSEAVFAMQSSSIPASTDKSNDLVEDLTASAAKAASAEPMDISEDARPSVESVDLPHRSAPQSTAAESVAGGDQHVPDDPALAPSDPVSTSIPSATSVTIVSTAPESTTIISSGTDQEMTDPPLSAKLARGRDEDGEDEVGPSAKRSKTDDAMADGMGLVTIEQSEGEQQQQQQNDERQAQAIEEVGSQASPPRSGDVAEAKPENAAGDTTADAAGAGSNDNQTSAENLTEAIKSAPPADGMTTTSQDAQSAAVTSQEGQASAAVPSTSPQAAAASDTTQGAPNSNSTSVPLISAHVAPVLEDTPITKAQQKFLLERLRNSKKIKAAAAFLQPVNPVAMGLPTYPDIIKTPMDMSTMEHKLKSDQYPTVNAFLADFNTMVQNSVTFNGREHTVSQAGLNLQAYFNKGLGDLPPADAPEPVPASKKAKKLTIAATPKATRRESRSSMPTAQTPGAPPPTAATVATPSSATSPQGTYALQPDGLPLIRRDSTAGDGRPKREIHRPPPRDLPYSAKPKKKKFQLELKFCETVCSEMNKRKHLAVSYPFLQPVDPVALNIPTYHKVIKKPMDFGTVTSKLKNGHYENAKEFHADVKLMFDNCFKFNPEKDDIHRLGKSFQQLFDSLWSKKDEWIAEHAPVSGPQSPVSDEGEEEDEAEEDDGEYDRAAKLLQIQQQISALSAEAQKMFQQSKRTPPKSAGGSGGSKKDKGGAGGKASGKASRKSGGSLSGPGGSSSKSGTKKSKGKPAPITHAQKQEIADAITSLQGQDMLNAIQIIRNGVPSMRVSYQKCK